MQLWPHTSGGSVGLHTGQCVVHSGTALLGPCNIWPKIYLSDLEPHHMKLFFFLNLINSHICLGNNKKRYGKNKYWDYIINIIMFIFVHTACTHGQFWNTSSRQCTECPINTFTDNDYAETCTICPEGQFTTGEGSNHCRTSKSLKRNEVSLLKNFELF